MGNDFNCLLVSGSKSNQKKGDKSVGGFPGFKPGKLVSKCGYFT